MNNDFSNCEALPQVEMDFMNTVHCEELQLVARLLEQLEDKAQADDIDQGLNDWLTHTRAHFEREERLMEEYHFPPYPVHKAAHDEALNTLLIAQKQWLESRDYAGLLQYITQEWRGWLQQHIMSMDRMTAHFFSQMGVQVEL